MLQTLSLTRRQQPAAEADTLFDELEVEEAGLTAVVQGTEMGHRARLGARHWREMGRTLRINVCHRKQHVFKIIDSES